MSFLYTIGPLSIVVDKNVRLPYFGLWVWRAAAPCCFLLLYSCHADTRRETMTEEVYKLLLGGRSGYICRPIGTSLSLAPWLSALCDPLCTVR